MPSLLVSFRSRLSLFVDKQAPNRVYWLLGTLVATLLLAAIRWQLGEQTMRLLSGQFTDTRLSPVGLLRQWHQAQPGRWRWALAEVLFDSLPFVPLYLITLAVWCQFYRRHSLFVTNPFRPRVRQFMQALGQIVLIGLLVGSAADWFENGVLLGWLFGGFGNVPAVLLQAARVLKLMGVIGGVFYLLLHPLGLVLAVRDAVYKLIKRPHTTDQEADRQALLATMHEYRYAQAKIGAALAKSSEKAAPLTIRTRLTVLFRAFMNVQWVVYLLLFMAFAFTRLDQFDEIFYSLLTEPARGMAVLGLTLLALGLWGGMVYVCCKILLFIQPNHFGEFDLGNIVQTADRLKVQEKQLAFLRNIPLWLAHAPFVILLVALGVNYSRLANLNADLNRLGSVAASSDGLSGRYVLIVLTVLSGWALFGAIMRRQHQPLSGTDIVLFKPDTPARDYALLVDQAPRSLLYGQSLLVLSIMLFVPTSPGLPLAQTIGLYAVVMLWLATVAYLGTIIIQFNDPFVEAIDQPDTGPLRFPVVLLVVIAGLTFSLFNDNSDIRLSPTDRVATGAGTLAPDASRALHRPDIDEYYRQWLRRRGAFTLPADTATTLPVIVVATAGGGIRAAAWTTEALQALNEQIRGFDNHLFAISGVSGGGVGAATYVAMRAGHPQPDSVAVLRKPLLSVMTTDLIAPTAASMLFRGGLHNFSPLSIKSLDRNRWLEDAWEQGMLSQSAALDSVTKLKLPQSFLSFWPTCTGLDTSRLDLPALLLNGAVAETGQKIIMTNLDLGNTTDRQNPFYDVADLFASIRHDVPYKTATFLCARFPLVTSGGKATGTLPNSTTAPQSAHYHVIDGGYAENTGILSAVQLIKRLQRVTNGLQPYLTRKIAYYLVFLPNSEASEEKASVAALRFLNEPATGFLKTWGRNSVALDQLIGYTLDREGLSFDYTSLTLNTQKHLYPLGWYISRGAVGKMTEQARANVAAELATTGTVLHRIRRQVLAGQKPAGNKFSTP